MFSAQRLQACVLSIKVIRSDLHVTYYSALHVSAVQCISQTESAPHVTRMICHAHYLFPWTHSRRIQVEIVYIDE
jgi:hypothetical protein